MANGAVRELITKIKFLMDKSSLSKADAAVKKVKQSMTALDNARNKIKVMADTSGAMSALSKLKSKVAGLRLNTRIDATMGSIKGIGSAVGSVGSSIAGAVAAYGGYLGASEIKATADEMMNLDGRLRTVTKDDAERLHLESELYAMGQKTRQQMTSLGELYTGVARTSNKMGYSMEQNLRVAETVSKALIIGGASEQQSSATILQLSQALSSGVLQGDELHSLDENASFLMQHVAEYFGTTIGGLKKMGSEGKLTSEEVMKAIMHAGTAIDKEFGKMPMTFSQSMTVMKNSWDRFVLGVEQKSSVFSTLASGMAKGFESTSGKLHDFLTLMGTPDANKKVQITEASTGETKEISETEYFNQKANQNPQMMRVVQTLKTIGEWFDELDGKSGNVDDQIGELVETLMKIGAVVLPILAVVGAISGLISILTPVFTVISSIGGALAAAFEPVLAVLAPIVGTGLAPILVILGLIASAIYFVSENWDTVVEMFQPGIDMMKDGLKHLAQAWEKIQPLITALTPLIKFLATLIGGTIVGALAVLWRIAAFVFNIIASLIDWVAGKLGGLGEIIQACAKGLSSLIDKALEFIGMKGKIGEVNQETTNRLFDEGVAGQNYTQSQYNTFNLSAAKDMQPAMDSANTWYK